MQLLPDSFLDTIYFPPKYLPNQEVILEIRGRIRQYLDNSRYPPQLLIEELAKYARDNDLKYLTEILQLHFSEVEGEK